MSSTSPALTLLVLRTADLEAARQFYVVLGLNLQPEKHGSGPEHFSCGMGDLVIELYPLRDNSKPDTSTMIGLRVPSLDEVLAHLKRMHIEPKSPPREDEWGRSVSVLDPDGRTVRLSGG